MREPPFWWQAPGLAARLLAPAAAIYGAIAATRLRRQGRHADLPVICIGNLTVGGSGKTPAAIAVARLALRAGLRPVFLTRGYGGRIAGPLRVCASASAADVGDEPLLLARTAPTIVARDRTAGAAAIARGSADAIVMDDGLQNPSISKDVALVALDGRRGVGNGRVIPAGPLRAPLQTQLQRAHAVLLVGEAGEGARFGVRAAQAHGLPVFTARLEPRESGVAELGAQPVLAYAGIADPEKFFATLTRAGIVPAARFSFPDHHRYSASDAARLIAHAREGGLQLVTTEKDLVRLQGDPALADLASSSKVLPVDMVIDEEAHFCAFLREKTGLGL